MSIFYYPKNQFFDNNGNPLASGKIYTYITGTSTPKATYTNKGGLTQHPNPIILDSAGRADIWLADDAEYRIIVKNSSDSQIGSTLDNQSGIGISISSFTQLVANLDANGYDISNINILDVNSTSSFGGLATLDAGAAVKNGSTGPGFIDIYEDTDNGSNKVQVIVPSSIASNTVLTLPATTGTALLDTTMTVTTSGNTTTLPGSSTSGAKLVLPEDTDNGSNTLTIKAADSMAANFTLEMPAAVPSSDGSIMTFTTAGVGSFSSARGVYLGALNSGNSYSSTSILSTSYNNYELIICGSGNSAANLIAGATNRDLLLQFYYNSAFQTTNYACRLMGWDETTGALETNGTSSGSGIFLTPTKGAGTTSSCGAGIIRLHINRATGGAAPNSSRVQVTGQIVSSASDTASMYNTSIGGFWNQGGSDTLGNTLTGMRVHDGTGAPTGSGNTQILVFGIPG